MGRVVIEQTRVGEEVKCEQTRSLRRLQDERTSVKVTHKCNEDDY